MTGEMVFTVAGATAVAATPIGLADAGLKERQHLQEWVVAHPQVLGQAVKIVAFEFGRWSGSDGSLERDRLDVLGLDSDGTLVVVELKRDRSPDTVEMQALKYAALVSRFTRADLAAVHAAYLTRRRGETVDPEAADVELADWATMSEEGLRQPRIILMATQFPKTVTATVVFLHQQLGLDIRLLAFQAYQTVNDVLVTVSQHYPPPDVEEFVLSPEVNAARQQKVDKQSKQREGRAATRLIYAGALEADEELFFSPSPTEEALLATWLDEKPGRRKALWQDEARLSLRWLADDVTYSCSGLVQTILREAIGKEGSVQGPAYWRVADGRSLVEMAHDLPDAGSIPDQDHLESLSDQLRPVFEELDHALLGLGSDVTRRSKVAGFTYYATRKLCDVRIRAVHLGVQISDLDLSGGEAPPIVRSATKRYAAAHLSSSQNVEDVIAVIRSVYERQ